MRQLPDCGKDEATNNINDVQYFCRTRPHLIKNGDLARDLTGLIAQKPFCLP
jgi:hypothetical protein